jgi:hypothetical protein
MKSVMMATIINNDYDVSDLGEDGTPCQPILSRRGAIGLGLSALLVYGTARLRCETVKSDDKHTQHRKDVLLHFGSAATVVQILGEGTYQGNHGVVHATRCVVQNDRGVKLSEVVWFDHNLPVVVGERWELGYEDGHNTLLLKKQLFSQE